MMSSFIYRRRLSSAARRRWFFSPSGQALEDRCLLTTLAFLPDQDNTLYEDAAGAMSNGAGSFLFAGRTGQSVGVSIRRGLVSFDLADEIPAGSVINSVSLRMNMSRTVAGIQAVSLHRVLAEWGEGDSNAAMQEGTGAPATAGDATWTQRLFGEANWSTPGGDFASGASATTQVGAIGEYTWSSGQMVADVVRWLGNPAENFGWLIRGNESTDTTAKRFDSREGSVSPELTIDFDSPAAATVSIEPVSASEGNEGTTPFNFRVVVTGSVLESVSVPFSTQAVTATEGEDYQAASGMLTFEPNGPRFQNITVEVSGDAITEGDETFLVVLGDPTGAELDVGEALGTIENDDPEPVISVADVSAPEGDADTAEVLLAVELSHASALEVSVSYATVAGSATETADYEPVTGRLTFAPGETSQTIPILVVGDTLAEDDETLTFQLSEPTNASLAAVDAALVTIVDDDEDEPVTFPWQNPEVHEDVTGDGLVVPLDALLVINRLNALGSGPLPLPPAPPNVPPPYFDVSGDNIVAPIDALLVINFLNAQAAQSVAVRQTLPADEPHAVAPLFATSAELDSSGEDNVDSEPAAERSVAADERFWGANFDGHKKRNRGLFISAG